MDIKAKFTDDNSFEITLTDDKVYVTAVGSQETFALRSVNGIGTYDDIEDYNLQLEELKKKDLTKLKYVGIGSAVLGLLIGLSMKSLVGAAPSIVIGVIFYFIGSNAESPEDKAKMKSYFRIMLSGGDRKFQFNKKASNAGDIAEFCNKVEDTLTAYNK